MEGVDAGSGRKGRKSPLVDNRVTRSNGKTFGRKEDAHRLSRTLLSSAMENIFSAHLTELVMVVSDGDKFHS